MLILAYILVTHTTFLLCRGNSQFITNSYNTSYIMVIVTAVLKVLAISGDLLPIACCYRDGVLGKKFILEIKRWVGHGVWHGWLCSLTIFCIPQLMNEIWNELHSSQWMLFCIAIHHMFTNCSHAHHMIIYVQGAYQLMIVAKYKTIHIYTMFSYYWN